jgi:hypothetical protein
VPLTPSEAFRRYDETPGTRNFTADPGWSPIATLRTTKQPELQFRALLSGQSIELNLAKV